MKYRRLIPAIVAEGLILLLLIAAPADLAQAGARGGGGGSGGGGRAGGFGGGAMIGGGRSGGSVGGGARGGVIGGGPSHPFRSPSFRHHPHRDHFFFGFGVSTFVPAWWWYDPYYYYWGPSAYYPYYGYPYPSYYGYPYYPYPGSDPCLSADPAYAPYCPPAAGEPPEGYSVPPVDYPLPAPSDGQTEPPQSRSPVSE